MHDIIILKEKKLNKIRFRRTSIYKNEGMEHLHKVTLSRPNIFQHLLNE